MSTTKDYRCEICGTVSSNPINWLIIRCGNTELTIQKWDDELAGEPGARHYCGEGHAQVYISRWFADHCTPPKPVY